VGRPSERKAAMEEVREILADPAPPFEDSSTGVGYGGGLEIEFGSPRKMSELKSTPSSSGGPWGKTARVVGEGGADAPM